MLHRKSKPVSIPVGNWISADNLANIIGTSLAVIKKWVKENNIEYSKVGQIWLISMPSYERLVTLARK
jgi:hypothetical protein